MQNKSNKESRKGRITIEKKNRREGGKGGGVVEWFGREMLTSALWLSVAPISAASGWDPGRF